MGEHIEDEVWIISAIFNVFYCIFALLWLRKKNLSISVFSFFSWKIAFLLFFVVFNYLVVPQFPLIIMFPLLHLPILFYACIVFRQWILCKKPVFWRNSDCEGNILNVIEFFRSIDSQMVLLPLIMSLQFPLGIQLID